MAEAKKPHQVFLEMYHFEKTNEDGQVGSEQWRVSTRTHFIHVKLFNGVDKHRDSFAYQNARCTIKYISHKYDLAKMRVLYSGKNPFTDSNFAKRLFHFTEIDQKALRGTKFYDPENGESRQPNDTEAWISRLE